MRRDGNRHCIHNEAGLAVGKMAARFAGQQSCNSPEKLLLDFITVDDFIFHAVYIYMSHIMRKPVFAICEQQRRRSDCASAQSDQHLCCSLLRIMTAYSGGKFVKI